MKKKPYIGRYAPSPTGELHLGNLRTALVAWLHARLHQGCFLLRIEDLDTPRVRAGSTEQILRDLEEIGIDWDGPVVYQSQRTNSYQNALDKLTANGLTYPCFCSRADIRNACSAPHLSDSAYPGTCANLSTEMVSQSSLSRSAAIRVRVPTKPISYFDKTLAKHQEYLTQSCGDFVLRRSDNLFAYQLAVVVDDLEQGITDVVRGQDLAESTARQIYLAQLLQPDTPQIIYTHVSLLLDQDKRRMAKRDGSESLSAARLQGKSVEMLIGEFARQLGLLRGVVAISAEDLLQHLTLAKFLDSLGTKT